MPELWTTGLHIVQGPNAGVQCNRCVNISQELRSKHQPLLRFKQGRQLIVAMIPKLEGEKSFSFAVTDCHLRTVHIYNLKSLQPLWLTKVSYISTSTAKYRLNLKHPCNPSQNLGR